MPNPRKTNSCATPFQATPQMEDHGENYIQHNGGNGMGAIRAHYDAHDDFFTIHRTHCTESGYALRAAFSQRV